MSLFKARDWWSTKCGEREEFDGGCLCVGNVDSSSSRHSSDKIVTGSFSGMLRIFHPRQKTYAAADLRLEVQLKEPIIQIELGRFVPGLSALALGVLMPRKFVVFTVESSDRFGDSTGIGDGNESVGEERVESDGSEHFAHHHILKKQYEHKLDRLAANFCFGPFGGVYGKDNICIQSFDGQLSFFEQDHFVFSRFLSSKYLTPGPILYAKNIDCFITSNNCFELECFRYQVLAGSTGSLEKEQHEAENQQAGVSGKKIHADWGIILGEEAYDICTARYSQYASGQNEIIVLGEKTLFVVTEAGVLKSQKRFDFYPSCLYAYNASRESITSHNLIIGTHSSTMVILKDPRMIWSAKLHSTPVAVRVGSFCDIPGMIVTLDDEGELCVNYIGTDPSFSNMGGIVASASDTSAERKEFDYGQAEAEHKRLKAMIRQLLRSGNREPREGLVMDLATPHVSISSSNERKIVSYTLILSVNEPRIVLENVNVTITLPDPFQIINGQTNFFIENLTGGSRTPTTLQFVVAVDAKEAKKNIITSLTAHISASYVIAPLRDVSGDGNQMEREVHGQRVMTMDFEIPLTMAGQIVSTKKVDTKKITLETTRASPTLFDLFDDIIYSEENSEYISKDNRSLLGSGSVMTFRCVTGQDATILISKNTSRYRIQGADFDDLFLISKELCRRLEQYHRNSDSHADSGKTGEFAIRLADKIPYGDLFAMIDEHFDLRLELKSMSDDLRDRSHQFRSIQKRLLVRFTDRNPTALNNFDILANHTYDTLMKASISYEQKQMELEHASLRLSNTVSLFTMLVGFELRMTAAHFGIFCQFLSPAMPVLDQNEQGWEETTEASMTHLLRTALAKNTKERESVPQPIMFPKDTSRLKKHIAIVIDRLNKGGSLESMIEQSSIPSPKNGNFQNSRK